MSRVVHFEFPADDPARASKFYSEAFGWEFTEFPEMDYWIIKTGDDSEPGINGGMSKRSPNSSKVTNTIGVADVDAASAKVTAAGGTIIVPKMPIPGVGYLAYFVDTEGNAFGMMQSDPSAA